MKLRLISESDLEKVLKWRNSPKVRKNMYSSHEITRDEHRNWFNRIKNDSTSLWYIFSNEDGEEQGVVYFTNYAPYSGSVFWGFYASPTAARGVGTKMEFTALEYAFSVLKVHKLNCEVFSKNASVINLHQKSGFTKEGCFRDYHFDGEEYSDVVRLGMLNQEWGSNRSKIIEKIESYKVG